MNNIKIAHVSTVHPRYDTRIYFREIKGLANSLSEKIDFFVYDGIDDENFGLITIKNIGTPSKSRFMRFILGSYKIFNKITKSNYKIIHFHDPELIFVMYLLSFSSRKIIFDVHECVSEDIKTKEWIPRFLRAILSKLYRTAELFIIRRFNLVIAESHYKNYYGSNTILARNFPDIQMIENLEKTHISNPEKDSITVCYLGAISKSRGIFKYTQAINELCKEGEKVTLLIVGKVPSDIEEHPIFQEGIQKGSIKSLGRLPSDKALSIISNCDVGLAVLDNEKNFLFSYPTKIFEYMALKMPVITSNFPLYKEVVINNNCGLVIDPDSLPELKAAIKKYCTNSELRISHGNNGYLAVKKLYSWDNELLSLSKFYKSNL